MGATPPHPHPDPWSVEQVGALLTKPAQPLLGQRPGVTCHCYLHSTDPAAWAPGSVRIKPLRLPEEPEGGLTSLGLGRGTTTLQGCYGGGWGR